MRAVALLAVGVVGNVACGGNDAAPVLPPGRAIETSRLLAPTAHLFADPVYARLEVLADRRLLDPDRVRVTTQFEPYETVGAAEASRRDFGEYTRLRFDYTLRCLTTDCIPVRLESILGEQEPGRGERRTFRFPPAQVRYEDPAKGAPVLLRSVSWPPVTSVSRLNEAQAEAEFPFRLSPTPLPSVSYRAKPWTLATLLLAVGLLLLVLPVRAVARWWRARRPLPPQAAPAELTPLERARALLVWSCERGEAERRRALSNFAAELTRAGADGVAADAEGLAWSRPAPGSEAVLVFARAGKGSDG